MTAADHKRRVEAAWARHRHGDLEHAYREYQCVLRESPDEPLALHYLGLLAHQTGRPDLAIELIGRSIALDRSDPRAFNHLGQVYAARKKFADAADCFRTAATLDPASADPLNNLANVLRKLDRVDEALALYRRAIEIAPASREAHYNLGKALRDTRAFQEALSSFARAIELDPSNHRAHYERALCLEELGRFDEAIAGYQSALTQRPDHARSIANLLALRSFRPNTQFIARAAALAASGRLGDEERAKLEQGLGKHFDREGDFDRAFTHFAASNAIQCRWLPPIDPVKAAAAVDSVMHRFSADHFQGVGRLGHPSTRPVFIVGMPRSGTTLVEQILASHPQIHGAGELMDIPNLMARYQGAQADAIRAAAETYLNRIAALAPASAVRVTDKLPVNYRHLGLIATLFPNARVIHCRRDPRDVALSCFIEMFSMKDLDFTDLSSIAEAIVQEARLMQHWNRVLPIMICEIEYHELLTDQVHQTKRLLEYCGVPWDERCLSFFETARHVDTPSRWQVRQPLYHTSVGRWRRYARPLRPAIAILQRAGLIDSD